MDDDMRSVGKVTTVGLFDAELAGYVFDLRWLLGLLAVLMIMDFWWGSRESKNSGVEWRFSRAGRRTCNKFIDYLTYIVAGAFMAHAIGVPTGSVPNAQVGVAIGIVLGCLFELDSVVKHIFAIRGIKFSFRRLLISLVKLKSPDWGEALDNSLEEEEKK